MRKGRDSFQVGITRKQGEIRGPRPPMVGRIEKIERLRDCGVQARTGQAVMNLRGQGIPAVEAAVVDRFGSKWLA